MTVGAEQLLLLMLRNGGTWTSSSVFAAPEGRELQRLGLVQLVRPRAPSLPYGELTPVGRTRAAELEAGGAEDFPF